MRWPRRSWCPRPERSRRVHRVAMVRSAHTTRLEGEMATRGDTALAALDLRVSPFLIGVYRIMGGRPNPPSKKRLRRVAIFEGNGAVRCERHVVTVVTA